MSEPTVTPRVDMSDAEIELIAAFSEVPVDKVRGIVWLAEWRMRSAPDTPGRRDPFEPPPLSPRLRRLMEKWEAENGISVLDSGRAETPPKSRDDGSQGRGA